jgi:predicted permease
MIRLLRFVFAVVLVTMLAVIAWASIKEALWEIPPSVIGHPWFIATLFDVYFAFLAFWLWVAYKECTWLARTAWLIAICILGNVAIAAYMLIQLYRVPADARIEDLLLRKPRAST